MDSDNYQQLALRTAKPLPTNLDELNHGLLGMVTEVGELADAMKKHIIYGKPLDETNVVEELGDLMWYVAIAAASVGVLLSQVQQRNIEKLQKRYPEKYTDELAAARLDKIDEVEQHKLF